MPFSLLSAMLVLALSRSMLPAKAHGTLPGLLMLGCIALVLQFVLAAAAAGSAAAPGLVLWHNLGAAFGLASLLGLARSADG